MVCEGSIHKFAAPATHGSRCMCGMKLWQEGEMGSRDPVNTDYSQLSHVALRLMAETQAEGNAKYSRGNWQKGLPVSQLASHAIDHILKLINGDRSENHLGHALWNLEKAAHFMETRPDLIDIPGGGLKGETVPEVKPVTADPNPDRNTNCWFCGEGFRVAHCKVIPPSNIYRSAHTGCYYSATMARQRMFDSPPGGPDNGK